MNCEDEMIMIYFLEHTVDLFQLKDSSINYPYKKRHENAVYFFNAVLKTIHTYSLFTTLREITLPISHQSRD